MLFKIDVWRFLLFFIDFVRWPVCHSTKRHIYKALVFLFVYCISLFSMITRQWHILTLTLSVCLYMIFSLLFFQLFLFHAFRFLTYFNSFAAIYRNCPCFNNKREKMSTGKYSGSDRSPTSRTRQVFIYLINVNLL